MSSRCLVRLAIAWATVAAGIAISVPASASVVYDPATKSGFIDRGDVQSAFGWTDAVLTERAPALAFDQEFWIDDTYSAVCGATTVAIVHHREYGKFELAGALAHHTGRGAPGYQGKLIGFRLTGAVAGISGTSMPPMVGQPCPATPDVTIGKIGLASSSAGWTLVARFNDARRELLAQRGPA